MSCSKWLSEYPNNIFVETGSGIGSGIDNAIKYGFKQIHSIEIEEKYYNICVQKYKKNTAVKLYLGDSVKVLPDILKTINEKTTFLLDAHVSDATQKHGETICPVLLELRSIIYHSKQLGIKHSILIDDLKCFTGKFEPFGNIKLEDIKTTILDIDSTYAVKYYRRMIVAN